MLLVETYLAVSQIEGLGVFCRQGIAKGSLLWRYEPGIDLLIEKQIYDGMEGARQKYLERYCYPFPPDPRYLLLEADDARFMNHSDQANCVFNSSYEAVAATDIQANEELTCNYHQIFGFEFEFLGPRNAPAT